jgi:amino acid adenylation domain-containing protein
VICLDSDWTKIGQEPSWNPPSGATGNNAAYVIYTSGSTGKPKGVVVTHQNVVRLFKQTEHWYGFDSSDVWTLFHSYTFDFSVWELWGALFYGGRLVVVPYWISRSPAEFYQLLAREKVTVLNQTPSAFRQLLWAEANAPAQLPLELRYVIFGGEALELQSLQPWFERHGDEKPLLVNMYGITETTVHVTYRRIRKADLTSGVGSVIGVPIPDLRVYLLDEKLEPVPIGVPGEIFVSGSGVARGYLNRAELSEQRFLTDPFSSQPARLYRSGDLARYTTRGELEYLGRMDHQVKIRGFRVELGEIESALNSHPAIRESVAIASTGADGSNKLIAYIVPRVQTQRSNGQSRSAETSRIDVVATSPQTRLSDVNEVREFLRAKLPDYMVPSAFVPLDSLPLTSNGKVDRRALPPPGNEQPTEAFIPPRNPTERALVQIWGELLGRKSVSIHENFFHIGGHSLLATQVIWRIAGTLQVDLPVRALFEAPTVAALAEAIGKAEPSGCSAIMPRSREAKTKALLERLEHLSDSELQALLQNPKLKAGS